MATTPTDGPLANENPTRGVHGYLDHATKALKREALLFDQIALPNLKARLLELGTSGFPRFVGFDELDWLQNIGIIRDIPPLDPADLDNPTASRQYLAAIAAETGEPIDVMAISEVLQQRI